jgi:hypothetical protein
MKNFYYKSTTKQNNTEYYNMESTEYQRLTNHIISFVAVLLERGVNNGVREPYSAVTDRIDTLREDRYRYKSTLHNEPISMLDALCGIITKINRRNNNDLTNRQIDMFNTIVRDFSSAKFGDAETLADETVEMVLVAEPSDRRQDNFNRLFN